VGPTYLFCLCEPQQPQSPWRVGLCDTKVPHRGLQIPVPLHSEAVASVDRSQRGFRLPHGVKSAGCFILTRLSTSILIKNDDVQAPIFTGLEFWPRRPMPPTWLLFAINTVSIARETPESIAIPRPCITSELIWARCRWIPPRIGGVRSRYDRCYALASFRRGLHEILVSLFAYC
jgi:hypothetical protein